MTDALWPKDDTTSRAKAIRDLEQSGSEVDGWAIAALVVAIVSFAVPVVLTAVALVMAWVASRRITVSWGRLRGDEIVRAARIVTLTWLTLQVVGTVLSLLLIRSMV